MIVPDNGREERELNRLLAKYSRPVKVGAFPAFIPEEHQRAVEYLKVQLRELHQRKGQRP